MINFKESTHFEKWFFTEASLSELQEQKIETALQIVERHLTSKMMASKGETRADKARNYKIPPEKEEKCLAVLVSEIKNQYLVPRFRNANFICAAMAYFQRFYLT
jgi:hypothetical protein